jgi:hypothetical protein
MRRVVLASCVLAAAAWGARAEVIDNFDDGNDQGWTRFLADPFQPGGPFAFDASSGEYRLSSFDTLFSDEACGMYSFRLDLAQPQYTDGVWSLRLRSNSNATQTHAIARAILTPTGIVGYGVEVNFQSNTSLRVYAALDDVVVTLATRSRFDFTPAVGMNYLMDFALFGADLSVTIWPEGSPRPAQPQLTATDSGTPLGQGAFGVALIKPGSGPAGRLTGAFDSISFDVPCDPTDFNGDGVFPDIQDVIDYFFVFGGGACPTNACEDIDFNNDGVFPDIQDVVDFLFVLAGGECP